MNKKKRRINIAELLGHTKHIDDFELKCRFTEEEYKILPPNDLSEIHPLSEHGEKILYRQINELRLRSGFQLNEKYFTSIIELNMKRNAHADIMNWFDDLLIESNREIILIWDSWGVVITKWRVFQKYYEDFFFPVSDDLTIIDGSINWALYLNHDENMFYGRNDDIVLNEPKKLFGN